MNKSKKTNYLANSTSPYLLQHVNNPVDWYPWSEAALAKAKREDKPILLSIGYSACHWCHVMAHESFEDEETAKLMNASFVNIKVDREERPDLDKIYQAAYQLLSQQPGGWPLTVFLTPDKQIPFFVGTYFPLTASHGRHSFKEILLFIADIYHSRRVEIEKQNQSLMGVFEQLTPPPSALALNLAPINKALEKISASFDAENGGFGDAPKFPHTNYLELLLHSYVMSHDDALLTMISRSLVKMAEGGIYDQIGGGFFRYSVDAEWQIPHFEKMLYDNALLLNLYVQAYILTKDSLFATTAVGIAEWVMREMQSPEGGYFATLDADSEGEEGKFYVWNIDEIAKILTPQEYQTISAYYDLGQAANFEDHWHLHVAKNNEELTIQLQLPLHEIEAIIQSAKSKLFQVRSKRIYPHRDEKILVAWNGLMIKAMAMAGTYLLRDDFIVSAKKALDFISKNMWRQKRLLASYKDNQANFNAYLDDYVFLIEGILSLLQADWNSDYYNFAINLIEVVLQHFQDNGAGGFFFTSDDHETLLYRPKNITDEAIPSGNAIAALVLNRLGYINGENRYLLAAEKTLKISRLSMQQVPDACVTSLMALQEFLQPPEIVIIRGEKQEMVKWQQLGREYYLPARLIFAIESDVKNLPAALAEKKAEKNVIAYICEGYECFAPVRDIAEFKKKLL